MAPAPPGGVVPAILMNKVQLKQEHSVRYLSIWLDSNLSRKKSLILLQKR